MAQPRSQLSFSSRQQYDLAPGTQSFDALAPAPPSEYETLPGLLRVLRRRWRTVALVAGGIIIIGTIACLLMTPRYSAKVTIEVNKDDHNENTAAATSNTAPTADELKSEIQTDINVLQSDGLALAVIQDLNLTDKRPFHGAIDPKEKDKPLDQAPRTRERLTKLFQQYLKVESPPDTRLINVTFQNPDALVAANVANALSNKFIEDVQERRHRSTAQASYWLQKQLDDLKKQVEVSEQKLADYERKTGLSGIQLAGTSAGEGGSSVALSPHNTVTDRLFSLNQELTTAEANRISTETVYRLVQTQDPEVVLGLGAMSASSGTGGGSGSITSDSGIELVRSLRAQEAALSREYAGYAVKYGSNNPRLIQLQQQIDAVKQQMHAELQRISKRAENAYLYAKHNEDTIHQAFTKQQSAANEMADSTVQLQVLAQEAFSNRTLYESLFSKLQTASLAAGVRATRIDIVDKARPAGTPSSPAYGKYLTLIAGVGIFFGISSAFLQESLDETLRTPRDLEQIPDLPMLGYVPSAQTDGLLPSTGGASQLIDSPTSPFSEAFRTIRTSVLLATPSTKIRTLLVTSAVGGDGKTTVVYNLGVAFAQQGARVLLIDGDLRNPDLHRLFGCDVSPGLSDLRGRIADIDIPGVVQHPMLPRLFMLPAGDQPKFPAELFGSQTFDSLLQTCASQYDYVLIDSPPILPVTDASIIATKVSGILAVLRSRSTTRPLLSGLVKALQRTHAPVLGLVLNDVRQPTLDGFHDYSYSRQKDGQVHANT